MFAIIAFLVVVASAGWLWLDLRKKLSSGKAFGISLGLMIVFFGIGYGVASLIPIVSYFNDLIGAGLALAFSTLIGRPVARKMLKSG
jgi:hypothetical protein